MSQISPKKLYQTRLKDGSLEEDPVQALAIEALQRLFEELEGQSKKGLFSKKPKAPKGVYLYGGVGRGKSMLMDLFHDCLPESRTRCRVHFHEFMITVHDYIHERRQAGQDVDKALPVLAKDISVRSNVLCFDEFHVTDIADAMILGKLFTELFKRGVAVVATSNWEPDRLYEGGLQRDRFLPFIELLKEKLEIFHLDSPTDYRTQFLAQEGTYFTPLGAGAQAHMDEVFAHLTGGEKSKSDVLEVKGRTIEVQEAARGVARFSFAQLCERPHGAEDFIEITEHYHTVLLENVPKLGYDRRNEAKRFMILIDAFYEAGTQVVVSADAPPDKLYTGHDHAFEFDRTISRLNEMQSAEYLQKT